MNKKNKHINFDLEKDKEKRSSGYTIPENYFSSLEEDILLKLKEESIPEKTGYFVPDTYFIDIENTILNKVNSSKTKVISLRKRFITIIPTAAAACVLLFIGLHYFTTKDNLSFESITDLEIENYIDNGYLIINNNELLTEISEDDFVSGENIENSMVTDEEMIEYINSSSSASLLNEIND